MKLSQLQEARYAGEVDDQMSQDFVEHVQWNKDHDYRRIENILRQTDPKISKELEHIYGEKTNELNIKLDDKVSGVSDDGYSDLLSHIVGSGKKLYDEVLRDWEVAQDIIERREYEEGFQYIWHHNYD